MAISHSAWGRVRRPKNILGPDGTTIDASNNNPLDSAETLTDDKVIAITSFVVSGQTLTMGINPTAGYAVGDHVQLEGVRPRCLADRSFVVTAVVANTSVSVRLDLDAGQEIRKTADVLAQGAPKLRRRTTDGYPTENARFLHLHMKETADDAAEITVHGYNYAFGQWSTYQLPLGIDKGDAAITDAAGGDVVAEAAAVSAGTVDDIFINVLFKVRNSERMLTIPINGIDRVAFTSNLDDKSTLTLSAAISTF